MSEPVAKDRPNVDLDDFERRLRQRDHEHEDPLAELARLVGETSDPYDDVFARERGAPNAATSRDYDRLSHLRSGHDQRGHDQQSRDHEGHDGMRPEGDYDSAAFGHDDDYRDQHGYPGRVGASPNLLAGNFAAIEAGLRGTMPAQADAYAADHEYYAQNERYPHDGYPQQDRPGMTNEAENWPAPVAQEPPRSRRSIYAMIATIALGVIGVGVAFAYKGSSSSPREIKTIAAATGPTKIQPPADASADAANQDSAMLGKGTQQVSPTRLVDGVEQPVDLGQAVQENASRNADAGGVTQGDASNVPVPPAPGQMAAAPTDGQPAAVAPRNEQLPSFGLSEMPPPKKVKVVSVRPDGTIMPNEAGLTIDSMTQAPAPAISSEPPSKTATAKTTTAKTSTPKGATPKTTSRVSSKPTQTAAPEADADATVPAPKPAHKAKPKKVAALEAQPDATNSADQAAAPASSGGGFAVQLAAPGSEAEAKSVTSRLAKKFADALDGRRLGVHKAQSNGKSVFRVRTSSLSREDAVSLCEKLKAAGGSCFVAKN